jgi:hypothetical protein
VARERGGEESRQTERAMVAEEKNARRERGDERFDVGSRRVDLCGFEKTGCSQGGCVALTFGEREVTQCAMDAASGQVGRLQANWRKGAW